MVPIMKKGENKQMKEVLQFLYPYQPIIMLLVIILFIPLIILIVWRIDCSIKERYNVNKKLSDDELRNIGQEERPIYERHKAMRQIASPNGINPYPQSYMVLNDGGKDIYVRSFTIDKMPKRTKFATTFRQLFSFENCTSSVFIRPISEDEASRKLDRHLVVLEGEVIAAKKDGDTNRWRKLNGQIVDAEKWAKRIELGEDAFYDVGFLFTIQAESLEELDLKSDTFHSLASEKTIEISATYGVQPEAFLSNAPYNKVYDGKYGPIKSSAIKFHRFDKLALSTIFNHTQEDFSHKKGILLGENTRTGKPVFFDPYDVSHLGYGLVAAGMTGTGKSATIKILAKRLAPFGYRYVCIDSQSVEQRGEYCPLAEALNGSIYQIRSDSSNILNFFDISEDLIIKKNGNRKEEVLTLRLLDKITEVTWIIKTMVQGTKVKPEFKEASYMEEIITDAVTAAYAEKEIVDGYPESLYMQGNSLQGNQLTSGKIRKPMPTLSDFYRILLIGFSKEKRQKYKEAYELILANVKSYVRELYYSRDSLHFFTKEEYEKLPLLKENSNIHVYTNQTGAEPVYEPVIELKGIRNYYDGQSTVHISKDSIFTDIDLSALTDSEKYLARSIAMLVVKERFVNKNSENSKKAEKLAVIIDEAHEEFPDENTRATIDNFYRTGRKKNVSVWLLTQAIADFKGFKETESILKQSAMKLIFKQDGMDEEYLKDTLKLTDSQVNRIISLGGNVKNRGSDSARKGEVCIIDNQRVCFCKVRYLKNVEASVVETDQTELEKLNA